MATPIPHRQRLPNPFSSLAVLLAATLAVVGCNGTSAPQDDGTASVQFALSSGDVLPASTGGASLERILSASAFSYSEVTQIRINIWETGKSSQPLYVNFDLEKTPEGTWEGSIPFLPKNKSLTFSASAYKAGDKLFEGTTDQILTGDN